RIECRVLVQPGGRINAGACQRPAPSTTLYSAMYELEPRCPHEARLVTERRLIVRYRLTAILHGEKLTFAVHVVVPGRCVCCRHSIPQPASARIVTTSADRADFHC